MAMGFELRGTTKMAAILTTRLPRAFPKEVKRALGIETTIEVKEVRRRTPKRSGDLRKSVKQKGPVIEGKRISTEIVAGGDDIPYALFVHEDLDAFHRIGQAKYLESVLLESRGLMPRRIARRIRLKNAVAR